MDFLEPVNGVNGAPKVQYNWVDITADFTESVKDLKLGELLHNSLFGLFEAMSAIEMMDPKMDAGMLCNRGHRKPMSFDQAVESASIKLKDIDNADMIAIMDTTFACVVSWLEGHSLAQTVFTNLYLHKPHSIEDKVLKTFCLAIYKLLEVIKEYVHIAMVYEEEDFQTMQYGYHLCPDVSDQRILSMLSEVEEELRKKTMNRPQEEFDSKKGMQDIAIFARISFLHGLYQLLTTLMHKKEENAPLSHDHQKILPRKLAALLDSLSLMKGTVDLGTDAESSAVMGFEPLINQRLLPPTFPRYTKIKPRLEALLYFESMINRFKVLTNIYTLTSFHSVLDFFIEFSSLNPCILSRSALQLLFVGSHTTTTNPHSTVLKELLKEAAKLFISPPSLVCKSVIYIQQAKLYVDNFIAHCTRPFANFLQLCGHNRARQRDKLAHLLEEFSGLQDEAERVDTCLHTISMAASSRPHLACYGTWVLYHTLRIMIMYLLSGFELELYSVHEYYYIYWYMYEFLYGWLVSALARADNFLAEQDLITEIQKAKGTKKRNKYKKKPRVYYKESLYYQALQNMCGGYYKALMGFRMDGKLQMPHPQFDCEQVRYDHRFAPFQNLLTPPPVHYPEFRELTSPTRYQQQPVDSVYLYFAGCKHFHQARQLLESIVPIDEEISDLLKISKTNFIVLKLLAGGHKKDSTKPPDFDFSINKHFPIIKLV